MATTFLLIDQDYDDTLDQEVQDASRHSQEQRCTVQRRVNTRGLNRITWTVAEKEVIFECFCYSRCHGWGREKNKVFMDQLNRTNLSPDKINQMTVQKFSSICSQVSKYISEERVNQIKVASEERAKRDMEGDELTGEEVVRRWTRVEKWVVLWAKKYATAKAGTSRTKVYTEAWRGILRKHCPNKPNMKINSTQAANIQLTGTFQQFEQYLDNRIQAMINNNICPLENPIPLPEANENTQHNNNGNNNHQPTDERSNTQPQPETNELPVENSHYNRESYNPQPNHGNSNIQQQTENAQTDESENISNSPLEHQSERSTPEGETSPATGNVDVSVTDEEVGEPDIRDGVAKEVGIPPQVIELENQLADTIERAMTEDLTKRRHLTKIHQKGKFKELLKTVNAAIPKFMSHHPSISEINSINYAAAIVIQDKLSPPKTVSNKGSGNIKQWIPKWKIKLNKEINTIRSELSRTNEYLIGRRSNNIRRRVSEIGQKYHIAIEQLAEKQSELKMVVTAKAKEIKNRDRGNIVTSEESSGVEILHSAAKLNIIVILRKIEIWLKFPLAIYNCLEHQVIEPTPTFPWCTLLVNPLF